MTLELRDYQASSVARVYEARDAGRSRSVLCLPTGGGKTPCGAQIILDALSRGERVLYVAHRKELLRSPFCKLLRYGVDPSAVGLILAGMRLPTGGALFGVDLRVRDQELWNAYARRRPTAPVQIASIDTLRGVERWPDAEVVIIDEAHRSLAKSYRTIFERYPNALIVGLTATPQRADGKGLGELYQELIVEVTYSELVARGYLCAPRLFTGKLKPDLAGVKVVGDDYNQKDLAERCNQAGLIGDMVEHYAERCDLGSGCRAPAMGFAVDVAHSRACSARFAAAGYRSAHVDGTTDADERDRMFEALATGELDILWNCDIAGEGTDVPCVKCVIMARPTRSLRVYLQQAGRGARPFDGPHRFIILDHASNCGQPGFGLPQIDRQWSLEGKKKRPGAGAPLVWTCEECRTANPLTERACLECGAARPVPAKAELEEHDGKLVEVEATTDAENFEAICAEWQRKNQGRSKPMKPGWIAMRFKERFGRALPPDCRLPTWTEDERRRRERFDADELARGSAYAFAKNRQRPARPPTPPPPVSVDELAAAAIALDGSAGFDDDFLPPVTTEWVA